MHVSNNYGGIMKVGDKLLCKKYYKGFDPYTFDVIEFFKGCSYEITDIHTMYDGTKNITIRTVRYFENYQVMLYNDQYLSLYQLGLYFHTMQDIRKLKLDRLGCTSLISTETKFQFFTGSKNTEV